MTSAILLLALLGIAAILLEMVLPGGILGVVGGLCLAAASVMCFLEYGFFAGLAASVALGLLALGLTVAWMKHFHRLPGTRELVLQGKIAPGDSRDVQSPAGQTGEAITEIAPSGRASWNDQRYDVIAEAGAIPKGSPVSFLRRSGPGWVVRPAEKGTATTSAEALS